MHPVIVPLNVKIDSKVIETKPVWDQYTNKQIDSLETNWSLCKNVVLQFIYSANTGHVCTCVIENLVNKPGMVPALMELLVGGGKSKL